MTTHTHNFHGKKEHSTTYAAASFLMPGAAARVEAIRAKKRKLKHAPPPSAPGAPLAAPIEKHHVEEIATNDEPEAGAHTQEQAQSPIDAASIVTNNHQGHDSSADVPAVSTVTSPPDESPLKDGLAGGYRDETDSTTSMPKIVHVVPTTSREADAVSRLAKVSDIQDMQLVPGILETLEMYATDEEENTFLRNPSEKENTGDTTPLKGTKIMVLERPRTQIPDTSEHDPESESIPGVK